RSSDLASSPGTPYTSGSPALGPGGCLALRCRPTPLGFPPRHRCRHPRGGRGTVGRRRGGGGPLGSSPFARWLVRERSDPAAGFQVALPVEVLLLYDAGV